MEGIGPLFLTDTRKRKRGGSSAWNSISIKHAKSPGGFKNGIICKKQTNPEMKNHTWGFFTCLMKRNSN